ncbi:MAG: hypothetical protein ABIG44_03865 [Planctomycetota bacterium]
MSWEEAVPAIRKIFQPLAMCLVIFPLAWAGPVVLSADTIYVDDDAPNDPGPGDPMVSDPAEDGSSAHPYDAIQEALDAANGGAIVVLDGTYTGPGNRDLQFGAEPVGLRSANGPQACLIDCEHSGRGFIFVNGATSATVVTGFTVTNAAAEIGAGLYCSGSHPTIRECVFTGNNAAIDGGGICCDNSHALLERCTISGNTAGSSGGGVICVGARPTLDRCIIADNTAEFGGGVHLYCGRGTLDKCTIVGNSATDSGGGVYSSMGDRTSILYSTIRNNTAVVNGGGLDCVVSVPTISGCLLASNTAEVGAGLRCFVSYPDIVRTDIVGNVASGRAGALACLAGGNPILSECRIAGNHALLGGAVHCDDHSFPDFQSCVLTGNTSSVATVFPRLESVPAFHNCTIAGNTSGAFGVIYCQGTTVMIDHCILWDNAPLEIYTGTGTAVVSYSNVAGTGTWPGEGNINVDPAFLDGWDGFWRTAATYDAARGQTTFSDNTSEWRNNELIGMFLRPDTTQAYRLLIIDNTATTITVWGDFSGLGQTWVPYAVHDYHLAANSPCIDAGDPALEVAPEQTDLDGDFRQLDGDGDGEAVVDIGADEYVRLALGDLNCDGLVNSYDITPFLCVVSPNCDYAEHYPYCDAMLGDCNGDGIVNAYDIDCFINLIGD